MKVVRLMVLAAALVTVSCAALAQGKPAPASSVRTRRPTPVPARSATPGNHKLGWLVELMLREVI